jgi:trk system potassium uptake protein TrkH
VISTARLRRAVRRETVGVDTRAALSLVGVLIRYLSLAFLFPIAIALWYGEPIRPFALAALITAAAGWMLELAGRGRERVGTREGFLVIALVWLLTAPVGALPFLLADEPQLDRLVDALFESMSGFTTTGSSVLTDIGALDRSIAMWRQFTQWLGGMGIIVLALAVLPRLRVGGRQLFETESPGPEFEPLTTTIRAAARRFLLLYLALTALEIVALTTLAWSGLDAEMTLYDAVAHALTTLPTGGFSPRGRSLEEFGAASQWVVTVFMILSGTNFALMYRAVVRRRRARVLRDEEFRLYLAVLVLATLVIVSELWASGILEGESAVRHAAFQAAAIGTTTGFASADFNEWTLLAAITLTGLMFIGASAGSTSGCVKVVRHVLVGKALRRELDETVHPEIVAPVRLNGRTLDDRSLRAVIAFVLLYFGCFAVGTLLLFGDAARVHLELEPLTAIAASATTLGNIGPAFGFAGPMGSFDPFSDFSKLVMIMLMWIGRLEIIPVVVLFTRSYWRA